MCCRFLWSAVCAITALSLGQGVADDSDGFTPLFNEKDLAGWVLVNTPQDTWTVQDGMLVCSGKPVGCVAAFVGAVGADEFGVRQLADICSQPRIVGRAGQ